MRVLVVYAEAGSGHKMAAQAIYDAIKAEDSSCEIECVDILSQCRFLYRASYAQIYHFLVRYIPVLWAFFFWFFGIGMRVGAFRAFRRWFNAIQAAPFIDFIKRQPPDRIIVTHFFPLDVIARLKALHEYSGRLTTVITDFGVHPFWIDPAVDDYAVASEYTRDVVTHAGVSDGAVRVTGIPVRAGFVEAASKYKNAGGRPFRILVASGGMGVGPIELVVECLVRSEIDVRIDVICGQNRSLHARLTERVRIWKAQDRVGVLGFVDHVHELMRDADLMISKPGGVTISECLTLGTPLVVISPIPGQEEMNVKWLREAGLLQEIHMPHEIVPLVRNFYKHPDKLERIRVCMRDRGFSDAARNIAQEVLK